MEDYNKEDRIMIAAIASAVAKAILYIGLCFSHSLFQDSLLAMQCSYEGDCFL